MYTPLEERAAALEKGLLSLQVRDREKERSTERDGETPRDTETDRDRERGYWFLTY